MAPSHRQNHDIYIYIYIYITKCENRWPLQSQPKKEAPNQNDTGPRKWSADQDKGRIAPFKLRNGIAEEECGMRVDDEEEKPADTESEITREGTKTLLQRCGARYADDNADRVYEDRIARRHTEEKLAAELAESVKQVQLLLKLNEEKKDDQAERNADTHKIIEESIKNQKAEMLN